MVRKIFFCSEFLIIPVKWWRKEEEERQLQSFLLFKETKGFSDFDISIQGRTREL